MLAVNGSRFAECAHKDLKKKKNSSRCELGPPVNRGVCLMQVYFTVNVGGKFWDSSWCPLNRGCPLNIGSAQYRFHCNEINALYHKHHKESYSHYFMFDRIVWVSK